MLTLIILCSIGSGNVWGATATLPVDYTLNGDSYPTGCSGYSITLQGYKASNDPYRLQFNGTGDYLDIQVDAAAQQIIFAVKKIGGPNNSTFTVQGSSNGSSYTDIEAFSITGAQNAVVNCTTSVAINSSYRYFRFLFTKGANVGFGTLKISKAAASCSNKVTLTKAATSNGSFTLHNGSASGSEISSGGEVDNCDNDAVVVVKPSANTHYHVASVEATNKKSLSGPDASGNYTITYTKGGNVSSTITVTFEEDPKYTVTWAAGSNPSFSAQTNYVGTALTAPGTPSPATLCPGDKSFVGWTATPIAGETNTVPTDLFTSVSGMSIPAENKTYYAVFAKVTNTYTKITTAADFTSGNYLVVNTAYSKAMKAEIYSSNYLAAADVTISTTTISNPAASLIWEVKKDGTTYTLYNTSVSKYCDIVASGSYGKMSLTASSKGFTASVSSGNWSLSSKNISGQMIRYNSSYTEFQAYNTIPAGYEIQLYKQGVSAYATTCSADPMLNVDPTTLNFGNVANGTYKEMTFSLSGTNLAENASIAVSGTNSSYFTVSPSSVNKGSGTISATDITVRYTPGAVGDGHTATVTVTSGEAEAKTVTLTGNCKATYSVSVSPTPSNGTVTSDKTSGIMAGETVTLTITPSSGYQLSSISAVDGSSNPVSLSGTGNSRTFTMPASNVTVTATFVVRTDYVLVTNVSELNDGDVITIANMKGNNAEGKILHSQADNNRNTKAVTTAADGKIADSDVEYPITLVSDASGWKLYDQENAGYLYAVKGSNYLKNSATPTPTYNDVWTIEIVQTAGDYQYQARIHQTPCNGGGCGQESSKDRYIEFNGSGISGYLYTMTDGYIYKKELGCDKLAAPTGLAAASITQTTVTLSWNSVTSASGYEISLDNGSSWTSTSTSTSYNATGLSAGTTYNWKVRATGDGDTYCAKGNAASSTVTMKHAVTVTYHSNGSTGGQLPVAGGVINLTEGDSHTILDNTGSGGSPTPLTKSGYTFAGWHNSSTYSATPVYTIGGSITVNSSIIIYANWAPKRDTYKDAVHGNADQYGDGKYTVPAALSDATRHTSGTCEETHYKFIGWCKEGQDPTNPANIVAPGTTNKPATGVNYYAVWGEEL